MSLAMASCASRYAVTRASSLAQGGESRRCKTACIAQLGGSGWHKNCRRTRRLISQARNADEDIDITTFRFTLGNEDLDNAVPRVVGVLAGIGLAANHLSAGAVGPAQERAEIIGAVLAGLCFVMPTIERIIRDADPGRGRRALAESIDGSRQVFKVAENEADALRNDLAWACFTLLKSTNACTAVISRKGDSAALVCRGAVGEAALGSLTQGSESSEVLEAVGRAAQPLTGASEGGSMYLADKAAVLLRAGGKAWDLVPKGCNAVFATPCGDKGWLVLLSEQERAFSVKERAWAEAVAKKISAQL